MNQLKNTSLIEKLLPLPLLFVASIFLCSCVTRNATAPWTPHAGAESVRPDRQGVIPEPNERPGLATGWGETISSGVYEVSFQRANAGKPTIVQQFYYNDRAGIIAQAGEDLDRDYGRVDFAGGDLEFGLKKPESGYYPAYHSGRDIFFKGSKGERYILEVRNNLNRRVEVVLSVDGLDVINGKPASIHNSGYIIDAKDKIRILGFRTSEHSVAAFRFSGVADSYAQEKYGDARNVGVIGLAAYEEANPEIEIREHADPFPSKYATPPLRQAKQ